MKKNTGITLITLTIIIVVLLVVASIVFIIINTNKRDNILEDISDLRTETKYSNQEKEDSEVDYESIAIQAEEKLSSTYTTNNQEVYKVDYECYATVDRNSIKYTNEYSTNDNDYYYVMVGTVTNSETGIVLGKYLIRCKWDDKNKIITDYGDNSRAIIVLNLYEEAIMNVTLETRGFFYIPKDQYKNDELWSTEKLDKSTFKDIIFKIKKIHYYNYQYSSVKNESKFDEFKNPQLLILNNLTNGNEIVVHLVQIVTDDELNSAINLTNYLNSDLYIANDNRMNDLIEYSKNLGLYYEETLK